MSEPIESVTEFLQFCIDNGSPEDTTVRAYRSDLNQWSKWCIDSDMSLSGITNEDAIDRAARKYITAIRDTLAPNTIARRVAVISRWAQWAGHPKVLVGYRTPRAAQGRGKPIKTGISAVLAMISHMNPIKPQAALLIALQGTMGLRVSEARSLTTCSFDMDERTVVINGKGGKNREVPISNVAWPLIRSALSATMDGDNLISYGDRTVRGWVTEAGEHLGLKVASHDLRATAAVHWLESGFDLAVAQDLLGHSDPRSTRIYMGTRMNIARDAVNSIST